ncbi:MAG: PAS domain S-box protein [Anaerolineales bacterium]|jgi:PAS domain S-box-containing protein
MVTVVLSISIILQIATAFIALKLIPITGKRLSWALIATAILLMAVRRMITFFQHLSGSSVSQPDLIAELTALAISVLMLGGIYHISDLFALIKTSYESLRKTNRALKTLNDCNQAIGRISIEDELTQEICRLIVEVGDYSSAWVDYADVKEEENKFRTVAQYGCENVPQFEPWISVGESESGQNEISIAVLREEPSNTPNNSPVQALKHKGSSALTHDHMLSIALPLRVNGRTTGSLNILASDPEPFAREEMGLLSELANDLSYAVSAIRNENTRRESEKRYRTLFETMREGFALHEIICDDQGSPMDYCFLEVNSAFENQTGLNAEEIIGKTVREVLPGIEDHWIETYGEVALTGKDVRFDNYSKPLDRYYTVDAFSPEKGKFATIFLDITDLKKAEEALSKSEERFRTITEGSLTGVYIIQDGQFRYVNPALAEVFGYSRADIIEKLEVTDLIHSDDQALVVENLRKRLTGEKKAMRYQFRGTRKDGDMIYCEVHGRLVQYQGSPAVIGTLMDISERKRSDEIIKTQLERLEALREIDQTILASMDLQLTFNVLLDKIRDQLKVDAVDVLVQQQESQTLRFVAGKGFKSEVLKHTRLRIGEGHAGQAAIERRIVHIPNLSAVEDGFSKAPLLRSEGFVSYYAVPLIAKGDVKGVLEIFHRSPLETDQEWLDFLDAFAGQAAIAIDNAMLFEGLNRSNVDLLMAYDSTLEGWARALEYRDMETEGHSQRVTEMAVRLAKEMGMNESDLINVRRGALLHDIGKIGIPDAILQKPGPLNDEEWELMRKHPIFAYEMLSPIRYLQPALEIPHYHHEKWDGTGYPQGLSGEIIPLPARIFAIIDVWDALKSDRPYREAWEEQRVLEYLREQSGKHFDPQVVEVFFRLLSESAIEQSELEPHSAVDFAI